jgi:hypothetical protein
VATTLVLSMLCLGPVLPAVAAPASAPRDSSILVVAGPEESGTRLIVSGRVLSRDGRTAAPQERVGVYHTDAGGRYSAHPTRRDARLSGWLVTDSLGRFEIRTIRPGPYPGGGTPAHIHFIVGGYGNYELRFADDPLIRRGGSTPAEGSFVQVRPVQKDAQGAQHVTVEWRLPAGAK